MDPVISDAEYQDKVLPHVSRTFALTIPQLPAALRIPVTNAYLLCRIADTIEDEPALSPTETLAFMQRFMGALAGRGDPQALGFELAKRLSDRTLPTERDLVSNLQRVINATEGLNTSQRGATHAGTFRSAVCRRHAGTRCGCPWAFAQRAGIYLVDSRQRGRNSPLLPMGNRACGTDIAEN